MPTHRRFPAVAIQSHQHPKYTHKTMVSQLYCMPTVTHWIQWTRAMQALTLRAIAAKQLPWMNSHQTAVVQTTPHRHRHQAPTIPIPMTLPWIKPKTLPTPCPKKNRKLFSSPTNRAKSKPTPKSFINQAKHSSITQVQFTSINHQHDWSSTMHRILCDHRRSLWTKPARKSPKRSPRSTCQAQYTFGQSSCGSLNPSQRRCWSRNQPNHVSLTNRSLCHQKSRALATMCRQAHRPHVPHHHHHRPPRAAQPTKASNWTALQPSNYKATTVHRIAMRRRQPAVAVDVNRPTWPT